MADETRCKNPFCLPEGTVRAFLAIMLVGALIWMAVSTRTNEAMGALISIATYALRDYFQMRKETK